MPNELKTSLELINEKYKKGVLTTFRGTISKQQPILFIKSNTTFSKRNGRIMWKMDWDVR